MILTFLRFYDWIGTVWEALDILWIGKQIGGRLYLDTK